MRYQILWLCHFIYWLRVHRDFGRAAWVTNYEARGWK